MADKIKEAYQSSKDIYDEVLTQGNFLSRLYIKVFWSGTAVFTERKQKFLSDVQITCLDYSEDMIEQAKKRWFTPPFPTEEQLQNILKRLYKDIDFHVDGSMVYFCCTK